jgi:hypothetical protein
MILLLACPGLAQGSNGGGKPPDLQVQPGNIAPKNVQRPGFGACEGRILPVLEAGSATSQHQVANRCLAGRRLMINTLLHEYDIADG